MKRIIEYGKEIEMLQLQTVLFNQLSKEYQSADFEKSVSDTERRIREISKTRENLIAEQRAKLEKVQASEVLREIFEMRYVAGLRFKEIADKLHYSLSTVFKLHRVLLKGQGGLKNL